MPEGIGYFELFQLSRDHETIYGGSLFSLLTLIGVL